MHRYLFWLNTDVPSGLWAVMIFCFSILLSTASAQEVDIEGTVIFEAPKVRSGISALGGYQSFNQNSGSDETDPNSNEILIWIEDKGETATYQKRDSVIKVLDQVDKQFVPRLMAIRVGDFVRIKNSDPVYHNVFSLSETKPFDVGRRSPKDYQDVQFDKAGVVDVFCDIHSDMHAVIRVLPKQSVAWQTIGGSGQFRFENIPKGEYTIHFFAPGARQKSIDVATEESEKIALGTIRLGEEL